MNKIIALFMAVLAFNEAYPQEDISYQTPSQEILSLVDVPSPPASILNTKGDYIVLFFRDPFKSIAELSETEMRLAGLRINPVTNISSRATYYNSLSILKVGEKESTAVKGLPENARLTNFKWSPDESKLAFTNTTDKEVLLWVLDVKSATARQVSKVALNANLGTPLTWFKSGEELLVKVIPSDKKELIDKTVSVPTGPRVSVNMGAKAQNRTYQDLLKDKADEFNFEQLTRSEIHRINLNGNSSQWMPADMYRGVSFSPDGKAIMVTKMEKPFSYIVTYGRFPFEVNIYNQNAELIKEFHKAPLNEEQPKGFMAVKMGKRRIAWRTDKGATLFWAEALDKGDPEVEVEFRDIVYQLEAPFDGEPVEILKTKTRYNQITWGSDNLAIVYDYWWNTRMIRTSFFDPSNLGGPTELVNERNYQDKYNDPGSFVTHKNDFGKKVLEINDNLLYLSGNGYSDDGVKPFIDEYNIESKETKRLWQADGKKTLESVSDFLDIKSGLVVTRIESQSMFPNYYIRNINSKKKPKQITFNKNPFAGIEDVQKEVIKYKREDGLELSATLYLPADYNKKSGEKLPLLMWAYPEEHKDKATASQVSASTHEFVYPWYGSPIFWVNKGYAILDDASFPIVGEGELEPNDSFIKQLVSNAKAAIDAVDDLGYVDRSRVAVGGHSYGAFMTANLLTHSDLFAAGIARSGAYNRTLTPFGFQSEERNYWEAPNIYYEMSPFMHAEKMKHPLLLIHGEADNNSGTYPMQSERYFNALKGLGATVRLVMLPKESHGYAAKESILHMLWETDQWLEKYVKNKSE